MKKNCLIPLLLCLSAVLSAHTPQDPEKTTQDGTDEHISIRFDLRFDGEFIGYRNKPVETGFDGKYFNLAIDGNISEQFSYSLRQRLYKDNGIPTNFFKATDWAYLTYHITPQWNISAGKQVVLIGGYEYDQAPIDVYFWSDFWNNVNPFQIGVTAGYNSPDGHHAIKAQVTNSPFSTEVLDNCFSYNLIWYGNMGNFSTIYSYNAVEYENNHFIHYLALGNRWAQNWFSWELDYMNRASAQQANPLSDFSIISRMTFDLGPHTTLFIKGGWDQNKAQAAGTRWENTYDRYVLPGVQYAFYGGGIEFYPIERLKKTLRLHAFLYSNNQSPQPISCHVGVRWQMNVYKK